MEGGDEYSTCYYMSFMDNVWREVMSTARAAIRALYGYCVEGGDEHSTYYYMSSMDNVWREVMSKARASI